MAENTVTEYATEIVYVCGASQSPSLTKHFDPQENNDFEWPKDRSLGLMGLKFFNDFESGDLMVKYQYDTRAWNQSTSSNGTGWNSTGNDSFPSNSNLLKRNEEDNVEASYTRDKTIGMRKELNTTKPGYPERDELNSELYTSDWIGATSTFMHIAYGLHESKVDINDWDPNFKRYYEMTMPLWNKYCKNNNKDNKDGKGINVQRSLYAGCALMTLTPTFRSVQDGSYERARAYINETYSGPKPRLEEPEKDAWEDLESEEVEFLKKLSYKNDESNAYITFMLNLYFEYGKVYECPAPDENLRIIEGMGATQQVDRYVNGPSDIMNFVASQIHLFGVGITLDSFYHTVSNGIAAPVVAIDQIISQYESSSRGVETASSTSIGCTSTYEAITEFDQPTQDSAGFQGSDDDDGGSSLPKVGVYGPLPKRRRLPGLEGIQYEPKPFSKFCDTVYKDESDKEKCNKVLDRHIVRLQNIDDEEPKYTGKFTDIFSKEFFLFNNKLPKKSKEKRDHPLSSRMPVYVVNAMGQSPGVACNALKFIAKQYENRAYIRAFTKADLFTESNGMLGLVRGSRYDRRKITSNYGCKGLSSKKHKWAEIHHGTFNKEGNEMYYGEFFQVDEFPFNSASVTVEELSDIERTCVPDYDNSFDGTSLGRFFAGTEKGRKSKKKITDNQCASSKKDGVKPPLYNIVNWSTYFPWFAGDRKKKRIASFKIKDMSEEEKAAFEFKELDEIPENSAFIVVVNVVDENNKEIDCSKYEYGTPLGVWKHPYT